MSQSHSFTVISIEGANYVTVADAATYLGVPLRTAYYIADKDDSPLKSRELNRLRLIELDSLASEKARRDEAVKVTA